LDTYKENPIHAAIAAPLMIGERLLGVIGIMNSDRNRTFSSSDKDLMHLFAQQAAIAVENAQLFEEKERQARVDITTNIYNRRGLLELGKRELDRAHRYERPLAAMMIDIDRFKRVNDSHGHAIGDLVLKELAHLLESNIRTIDILGRYGGEEFVILLPETSPESAYEIAERLRKKVSDHTFKPESLKLHITISIGLAFSSGENSGLQDLIRRADDAMYRSKGAGRNLSSFYKSS
jgi:diguanylate cyclase (GGDEF)-like protein